MLADRIRMFSNVKVGEFLTYTFTHQGGVVNSAPNEFLFASGASYKYLYLDIITIGKPLQLNITNNDSYYIMIDYKNPDEAEVQSGWIQPSGAYFIDVKAGGKVTVTSSFPIKIEIIVE